MRAFVAVELPDSVRAALRESISQAAEMHPEVAWTDPVRWHLTLAFLAELPEERVPDLVRRLERAGSRTLPFELALDGVGRFGHRVVLARVAGDVPSLRRLAHRTAAAARRAGVDVPEARYRPHLTLGRARRPIDLRPVVDALDAVRAPTWRVDHVVLVKSVIGADPQHEVVARVALSSPGGAASTLT